MTTSVTTTSNSTPPSFTTFDDIYSHLTSKYGFPILPHTSPSPYDSKLSHAISSLNVHPTLEALLHILNLDLPSAHFLCRHMENRPAYEAMFLHGLLHRIESDYRNAELWYGDVSESEIFAAAWPESRGGLKAAHEFIQRVEMFKKKKEGDKQALQEKSKVEIEAIAKFLKEKFGTDAVVDATTVWVEKPEKSKEAAKKMIVGGEGWRQF
jgi:hypothetical protein